jgi:hypothetical protein
MFTSRSRAFAIAMVAGALSLFGTGAAIAGGPDEVQKGIAPGCALPQGTMPGIYAPPLECQEGPVS